MGGFLGSFIPLIMRLKGELILITVSLLIGVLSLSLFVYETKTTDQEKNIQVVPTTSISQKIMVDVSGAVINPNLYEVSSGARLKDVIDMAGGLTEEADEIYISQTFNLAKILLDQDKIYIPTRHEVEAGYATETISNLSYSQALNANNIPTSKININIATLTQLDTLPGVGTVTAENIIAGRPYNTVDDLLNKQVVRKALYDKIKDLIIVH